MEGNAKSHTVEMPLFKMAPLDSPQEPTRKTDFTGKFSVTVEVMVAHREVITLSVTQAGIKSKLSFIV